MKCETIIKQLRAVLPRYTDLFGDTIAITSLSRIGTTVTAVTSVSHELVTGKNIYINGALTSISIISLTRVGEIVTAITASDHDLTENYQETIEIIGADQSEYNGSHPLLKVPNRRTFTFSIVGTPITPATGTIKIIENIKYGYNGYHKITYVDPTTFTYQITSEPESPAIGTINIQKNLRITGAISADKCFKTYTKQSDRKLYLYAILGNLTASKDRNTLSDATFSHTTGQDFRQCIMEPFTLLIFVPSSSEITGLKARDLMQDLAPAIFKSILRLYLPSVFSDETQFSIIFTGHSFFQYSEAYYVHAFNFENIFDLTYDDTIDTDDSVAFRDIHIDFYSEVHPQTSMMTSDIDLDDEPLT